MGTPKYVYRFGAGKADGSADMKNLLGGKGANLAEMSNLGLPVPPGFTITTEVCTAYYANGKKLPEGLHADVQDAVAQIGTAVGAGLGDCEQPASGVGPLGQPRLDARHDGHDPQSRPQRRTVEGLAARSGQPPLRLR